MKRFITLSLSALIMLAALTACGKESPNESAIEQTVSEDSTQTVDVTESTEKLSSSSAEETVITHTPGEFNIDDAVNDIVIDGKRYKVPTTLEELGESYTTDFEFEAKFIPEVWGKCMASLVFANDKPIMTVYTQKGKSDKVEKKDEIFCIQTSEQAGVSNVYGLKVGEKLDSMIELWGEPIETETQKSFTCYYYGGSKNDLKNVLVIIKDGYIDSIEVLNKR